MIKRLEQFYSKSLNEQLDIIASIAASDDEEDIELLMIQSAPVPHIHERVQKAAREALMAKGKKIHAYVADRLRNNSGPGAVQAARILVELDHPEAATLVFEKAKQESDYNAWAEFGKILVTIAHPQAIDLLIEKIEFLKKALLSSSPKYSGKHLHLSLLAKQEDERIIQLLVWVIRHDKTLCKIAYSALKKYRKNEEPVRACKEYEESCRAEASKKVARQGRFKKWNVLFARVLATVVLIFFLSHLLPWVFSEEFVSNFGQGNAYIFRTLGLVGTPLMIFVVMWMWQSRRFVDAVLKMSGIENQDAKGNRY